MAIKNVVVLDNGARELSASEMTKAVSDSNTVVLGFYDHKKASEKYVIVRYTHSGVSREWVIPYQYRRTNTFVDDEKSMVELIRSSKSLVTKDNIERFKRKILPRVKELFGEGATVTIPIFKKLLSNCGKWVWNKKFENENPQRRIQDIKETGFTIATRFENRATYHMLLPFMPVKSFTYETIPPTVRRKIFSVHRGINAFTGEPAGTSCLPDHKFSEIRWNKDTPVSNENLTEAEMRDKFQIIPESVNQAKRETCRKCFQTGMRGTLNGIRFFYKGNDRWDDRIPKLGKSAEDGCVGCFWYDMLAWRKALHKKLGVDE